MTTKSDQEFYDAAAMLSAQTAHGDMLHLTEQLIRKFSAQDETHTASMWIRDIEENGEVFKWTPTQLLLVARRSLTGTAALWLRSEKVYKSWEELKGAISKEFLDTLDVKKVHELMSTRRKRKDESCIDYMLVMKELGKRGKMPDYVAIKYIVDGIIDDEINKIMLYGVTTYADLKEKLKLYAMFKINAAKDSRRGKPHNNTQNSGNSKRNATAMMRCFNCGQEGHASEKCPHRLQGKKCFHCNEFGHIASNCPTKKMAASEADLKQTANTSGYRKTSGTIGRYEQIPKVGTTEHEQRRPFKSNQMSKEVFFNLMREGATSSAVNEVQDEVQGKVYIATTGANTSANDLRYEVGIIQPDRSKAAIAYGNSGHDVEFDTYSYNVNKQNKEPNDNNLPGVHLLPRHIKPLKTVLVRGKTGSALVDSGCDVNLMSKDFYSELKRLDSEIQCNENNITLTGLGYSQVKSCGVITLDITIDDCLYRDIKFYVMPNDSVPFQMIIGNDFLRNVTMFMKDCMVWLLPKDDRMNPNYEWLNDVACFSSSVDCLAHVSDPAVKEEVARLVTSYVPQNIKEAPIELKIVLKDDLPVSQRPRRISFMEQENVDRQIQEWLDDGIIRVSYSEYSSPLVLVRKKDGSLRICVDYRKINGKMVKDEYPVPIIDDHIDKLSSARISSALDLKNGYFHLRVHKDSIKYTSFVTTTEQYEFLRAPFGLASCPKVFTRFITIIFRELIMKGIVIIVIDAFTKFVWLFPCRSTTTREVLSKLEILQQTFGNPERFITDRGTAFTSNDFQQYCQKEGIELCHITTGVPRGNGQVERVHRTIIPVLTKLCIEKPGLWYRHVGRVQMALNITYQRSVNTTPFEMLIGKKMKRQEDIEIYELLQQEGRDNYIENREDLRKRAKQQILEVQQENRKNYNKHRKNSTKYQEGDLVAIKRTQFGPGLKLKPKFLGPYQVTKIKRHDRYDVEKIDTMTEGPSKTTTSADHMKKWPDDKE